MSSIRNLLALAAMTAATTAPAHAATEELPRIEGAEWMCEIIILIAETLGPNIPTEVEGAEGKAIETADGPATAYLIGYDNSDGAAEDWLDALQADGGVFDSTDELPAFSDDFSDVRLHSESLEDSIIDAGDWPEASSATAFTSATLPHHDGIVVSLACDDDGCEAARRVGRGRQPRGGRHRPRVCCSSPC